MKFDRDVTTLGLDIWEMSAVGPWFASLSDDI
jgi:hypothetical protein